MRIVDNILSFKLESVGAVVIEGTKWCGKTTTAEQSAKSVIYLDDPEFREANILNSETPPKLILSGENPRLLDEWQLAPALWDAIRSDVDHRKEKGLYILTDSAVPKETEEITHSGTGRFSWILMRPMSLYESGESNGKISLSSLFDNPEYIDGKCQLDLTELSFLVSRGGWPGAIGKRDDIALSAEEVYLEGIIRSDVSRLLGERKDPNKLLAFMRSFSRHQGTQAPLQKIMDDIDKGEGGQKIDCVRSTLSALKRMYTIEDMSAWNPNLRSKSAIRQSDTHYFVDPSIAVASLGLGPNDLLKDLKTFGFLFETMAIRDLRVYADSLKGNIYHFRDRCGNECDAVLHLRNGKYAFIEIKLGGEKLVEEGAESLKKISSLLDKEKMNEPSFMMVLTGIGSCAYKRKDGVFVVPIGMLKP